MAIRDGLIAAYKDRKVRVRIAGDIATVLQIAKIGTPVSRNNAVAWPSEMSRRYCFGGCYSDGRVHDES